MCVAAANRIILAYLCRFLKKVSDNSEDNRMTSVNIALVFSPNLFRSLKVPAQDALVKDSPGRTMVFQLMIDKCESIFDK